MTPIEIKNKVVTYLKEVVRLSEEEGESFNDDMTAALANLYLTMDALHKKDLETACDELAEAEAVLFESDEDDESN